MGAPGSIILFLDSSQLETSICMFIRSGLFLITSMIDSSNMPFVINSTFTLCEKSLFNTIFADSLIFSLPSGSEDSRDILKAEIPFFLRNYQV